jgi:hypothetical protein
MQKLLFTGVCVLVLFSGCTKNANQKLLKPFISFTANGKNVRIDAPDNILTTGEFTCRLQGDTSFTINVADLYEGVGFYLQVKNGVDGLHTLNHVNKAYYTNPKDYKRYTTDSTHTGEITITRGTFQAKDLLTIVEGTFAFAGIDAATNKTFTVTNGVFRMELEVR